ncbi:MAG: Redoxin domain protein, partial [Marmoricola sp.]|nr:Redoxin domain protein [Marmoricola sp.]
WASWCGPCREELPRYAAFAKAYAGKVDVVGLDFQDTQPQAARDLLRTSGVTYPSYRDPDGEILRLTRSRGIPQVVLVDARGRAVFAQGMVIRSTKQLEDLVATHLGVRR